MFAPDSYETLASLWKWFENRYGTWCRTIAMEFYRHPDKYTPADIFGSPRDLCEDLFLRSLEGQKIVLTALDTPPVNVDPVLSNSAARVFEKATPLESFIIAMFPNEAGPGNEWLIRMGSRQFVPSGHTDAEVNDWLERQYCGDADDDQPPAQKRIAFHTLPYLFERGSFVFPSELPPWASDMLEDAFVRGLKDTCGGRSMCLSVEQSKAWRRSMTKAKVETLLAEQVPSLAPLVDATGKNSGGRPKKTDWVKSAIRDLKLMDSPLSLKEKLRRVIEYVGEEVSETTLKRALRALKKTDDAE